MRRFVSRNAQRGLAALLLTATAAVFLGIVSGHYPLRDWLLGHVARASALAGGWAISLVGLADPTLRRVFRGSIPAGERLVFSFATGLFAFFLLMFVAGALGLLGPGLFVVTLVGLPAYAMAANARYVRRVARLARSCRGAGQPTPRCPRLLLAVGAIAMALVYFKAFSLEHLSYDARWYHFPLAENYAALGRIARFPEGWYPGAYPQLASYAYTWALLEPFATAVDRYELASHMEIAVFVATLASIPVAARRLLHGVRVPGAWVALFLFPAIFAHDGNLTAGADHFAAFWTLPALLAVLRIWQRFDLRHDILFCVAVAGLANTKYSAYAVVLASCSAVGGRYLWLAVAPRSTAHLRWRAVRHVTLVASLTLVLTSPHWLKNWFWYGDPLYPTLHRFLATRPWSADAEPGFDHFFRLGSGAWWMHPAPLTPRGAIAALRGVFEFSFVPHDWPEFHHDVPVFGSLFTLLGVLLPFGHKPGRRVGAYLFVCGSVFVWMFLAPQDRYLQQDLPAMASVVAALVCQGWRMGAVVRGPLVFVLGAQVAWGLDVPFIPSDNMVAEGSELRASELLASSGYRHDTSARQRPLSPYLAIGPSLPRGSKVLIHEVQTTSGLGTAIVNDSPSDQALIHYAAARTASDVYDLLRGVGTTHLLWRHEESSQRDSIAGDLVFFWFTANVVANRRQFEGLDVGALPMQSPGPIPIPDEVAVMGCNGDLPDGLYRLADLAASPFDNEHRAPTPFAPFAHLAASNVLDGVGFVIQEPRCRSAPDMPPAFILLAKRGRYALLGRAPFGRTP
jgi:hypothetical protein